MYVYWCIVIFFTETTKRFELNWFNVAVTTNFLLFLEKWGKCKYLHYFLRARISSPLARREAPAEGRRPEGEGDNIDRRLVPYHGKCKRIQSHIEFIYIFIYLYIYIFIYLYIYIFIYLYICINRGPHARGNGILALVNSLQQKLIWLRNKPETVHVFTAFFFQKEI